MAQKSILYDSVSVKSSNRETKSADGGQQMGKDIVGGKQQTRIGIKGTFCHDEYVKHLVLGSIQLSKLITLNF